MIVINGRFLTQKVTGVQRYARELIRALDEIVDKDEVLLALPPEAVEYPVYKNIKVVRIGKLHNRLWEHLSLPLYSIKSHATSLNLCNVAPLLSPGIVCQHGAHTRSRPQDYGLKFLLWYRLLGWNQGHRCKRILTVSDFSKSEILKYQPNVNSDKIIVIPNAWQHFERTGFDDNTLTKYGLEKEKYYFSMSSFEPNKNFKWVAETAKRNPDIKFAVSGAINEKVFADGLGFKRPENMLLLGYVSDAEAKTLMRDCAGFLFPTYYEGFGIPPLEALSAGAKRIVVADIPVMHEVFEGEVYYIDPDRYDYDLSQVPERKGNKALYKYSWEKSARKLYDEVIKKF